MRLRDPGVYLEDIERYASAAVRFAGGYRIAIADAPKLLLAVRVVLKGFPDPSEPTI